jgi:rubredoxin
VAGVCHEGLHACCTGRFRECSRYNRFILDKAVDKMMASSETSKTWMCLICGWIYDETEGAPDHGIAPGTAWADVPMNWTCPECGARKEDFEMVQI